MKTSLINNCLIGYTGFVGSTILSQNPFKYVFNSSNIAEIKNKEFDLVLCSAAPAQKWIANKYPDEDKKNLELLTGYLETIKCKKFILISTVDVFAIPIDVDENSKINESNLLPYGLNRMLLEKFAASNFKENLIVRLPGLVGTGLKKNIIFDFINNNNTHLIDSRGIFQFYPMAKLWQDINIALKNNLSLIHLTSEPLSIKEIALSAYMHWEFGKLNIPGVDPNEQNEEKLNNLSIKINDYLNLFKHFCNVCGLTPNDYLLKMCILIACADISSGTNIRLKKNRKVPKQKYISKDPWVLFKMDKRYLFYRQKVLDQFNKLKTSFGSCMSDYLYLKSL